MKKNPTVQIDKILFNRICAFFLLDHREPEQEQAICDGLQAKMNAIQRRTDYAENLHKQGQ